MKPTLLCLSLLLATLTQAQAPYKKVPVLYQQDILINTDVYRLSVKEVISGSQELFRYTLQDQAGERTHFTTATLSTGAYNLQVLTALLSQHLQKLDQASATLAPVVEDLTSRVQPGTDLGLTEQDSALLRQTLESAKSHYAYQTAEAWKALDTLMKAVSPADSIYLLELAQQSAQDRQQKQDQLNKLISPTAAIFLEDARKRLYQRNNQGPIVGKIAINDTIQACDVWEKISIEPVQRQESDKKDTSSTPNCFVIQVGEVQLEFEREQIVGIKVEGQLQTSAGSQFVIFQNRYPISYSTKADVSQDFYALNNTLLFTPDERFNGYSVKLRDIFRNDYQFLNRTENYSPMDDTLTIRRREVGRLLYKEPVTEILQAKIFSDFIGLAGEQPNGLVQVEIAKRISLNTRTKPFWSAKKFFAYTYYGLFNYIEPNVMLTKLEDNNKILDLGTTTRLGSIEAFQYRNFSTGGHLNIGYIGYYRWHSAVRFDIGANFQRTAVRWDTITEAVNVNTLSLLPRLSIDIYPHPSYGITFEYQWQFMKVLDQRIDSEVPNPFFALDNSIHRLGFIASVSLNEAAASQFFFRTQFNFSHRNPKRNFLQAQLGYAFSVFSRPPSPSVSNPLLPVN
jgi:hypothetical protein